MFAGKLPGWQTDIPALMGVAKRLTEMSDAINTVHPIIGVPPIRVQQTPKGGTTLSLDLHKYPPPVMVKITGSLGNGNYTGRQFWGVLTFTSGSASVPGNLTDPGADNCIVVNLAEVTGGPQLPTGAWIIGIALGQTLNASNVGVALVVVNGSSGIAAASLTQTGGADGTATTPASWTYTAASLSGGVTFGTAMSLNAQRPNGSTKPAVSGLVVFKSSAWVLWWCDEVPNTTACS
ncbi:MAG TPA: hypothetical protein VMG59_06370 [Phycisphaerae bacterium]|nr:hypothetical protein [Phycisphaerae bacterium]